MTAHIYALINPENNECRYIGKTRDPKVRLDTHLRDKSKARRVCWIKSMAKKGIQPEMLILESVPHKDWVEAERFWIAYFKFLGANLVNGTHGGDGGDFTLDIRKKLSEKAKAQWENPELRKRQMDSRGPVSEERKQKHSEGVKRYLSDSSNRQRRIKQLQEHRCSEKRLQNLKIAAMDPERREQKRQQMIERYKDPAARALQSEKGLAAYAKPEVRARFHEAVRAPETRKKMSEAAKKRFSNPEERKRLSEIGSAARLKRYADPIEREKQAKVLEGIRTRPGYKEKILAYHARPETKEKISAARKAKWADPEYRKMMLDAIAEGKRKAHDKLSAVRKAQWEDPEFKRKTSEAIREGKRKAKERRNK